MSQAHSTAKRRTFKHLNSFRRGQIEVMLHLGIPKVKTAKGLGIARPTLHAEIKRSTVRQMRLNWPYYDPYFAETGQIIYERNRAKPSKLNAAQDFIRYAEDRILKGKHTPDAICGCARRIHLFEVQVCTKTICNYIAMGLLKVKNIDLRQNVRRKHRSICLIRSLRNAVPLAIGNWTPSSEIKIRILFCSPQMNARKRRDTL